MLVRRGRPPRPAPRRPWVVTLALVVVTVVGASCGSPAATTTGAPGHRATPPAGSAAAASPDRCAGIDLSHPPATPVTIRFGHGYAAEEQAWLMWADPTLAGATHYGRWYVIAPSTLQAPERLAAAESGKLDAGTVGSTELVQLRAQGADVFAVASIAKEAQGAFTTTYAALRGSAIRGPRDLPGKRVGVVSLNSNTQYWVESAMTASGIPDASDRVQWVPINFPDEYAALKSGQINVGVFVQPFWDIARRDPDVVPVFDSLAGPRLAGHPFDQELLDTFITYRFLDAQPAAACAWRQDYVAAITAYARNRRAATEALVRSGELDVDSVDGFVAAADWRRPPDGVIDLTALDRLIDDQIASGFVPAEHTVRASELVVPGFSLVRTTG